VSPCIVHHIARFRFLRNLWFAPRHRLLPCDLAEALAVTTPTVTAMVDGLEKDGLVTRLPNERDRRSNIITLTEKGEEACALMMPRSAGIAVQACAGFTEEEKKTLAALLFRYWQNLPEEGEY
jgi:DNA-binding MarR family transcriptional regulator